MKRREEKSILDEERNTILHLLCMSNDGGEAKEIEEMGRLHSILHQKKNIYQLFMKEQMRIRRW